MVNAAGFSGSAASGIGTFEVNDLPELRSPVFHEDSFVPSIKHVVLTLFLALAFDIRSMRPFVCLNVFELPLFVANRVELLALCATVCGPGHVVLLGLLTAEIMPRC
jgi:hypothetical protein